MQSSESYIRITFDLIYGFMVAGAGSPNPDTLFVQEYRLFMYFEGEIPVQESVVITKHIRTIPIE